jgi:hypothetical protein
MEDGINTPEAQHLKKALVGNRDIAYVISAPSLLRSGKRAQVSHRGRNRQSEFCELEVSEDGKRTANTLRLKSLLHHARLKSKPL